MLKIIFMKSEGRLEIFWEININNFLEKQS